MIGPSPAHSIESLIALRRNGPWQRRRYWLPEGFNVSTPQSLAAADSVRPWHRRTVQPQPIEIGRVAVARAVKDQLRKRARRLALRDAERKRAVERVIRREAAATERRNAQVLALAVARAAAEIGR